jgi:hypothetical protein
LGESGGCSEREQERKGDTERFHISDLLLNLWNWVGQRAPGSFIWNAVESIVYADRI